MRLLVATDQWAPDTIGGSARVAAATAHELAVKGHEVVVLAPSVPSLPKVESIGGVQLRREIRRGILPQTFGDVVETRRAAERLDGRFDVLVAHQATNAVGLRRARPDEPLAFVFHASVPLEQQFMRPRLSVPRRMASLALAPAFAALEKRAVAAADRVLVLSEFSRNLLVEHHPNARDRVEVVGGGVEVPEPTAIDRDSARRALGVPAGGHLLLTVRRLDPRMGLEELLHAAARLRDEGLVFLLVVAGDGMLAARLERLGADLDLVDRIRFLGRVTDRKLQELYAAADLFVLPTVAYEGFGMATLEALAAGVPVVGTPVGATPELLLPLDRRFVARAPDAESLAESIRALLVTSDDDLRTRCAAYAQSRYAWSSVIQNWELALAALPA